MTEIHHSNDCGNSPKNKRVADIAIALELGTLPGHPTTQLTPQSVTITHAFAHGKVGAAHGHTRLHDGTLRHFCHIIEFTSASCANIRHIESYS